MAVKPIIVKSPQPIYFVPLPSGDPAEFARILYQQGLPCDTIIDLIEQAISQGAPNISEWVELRESLKLHGCDQLQRTPTPPPTTESRPQRPTPSLSRRRRRLRL